jgi:hypothetical protein
MSLRHPIRWALAAVSALAVLTEAAGAQAWNYPSFQPPRVTGREVNFALGRGGDPGESLVVQWREPVAPRTQLSLDVGFASPTSANYLYADSYMLAGGQFAHQLARGDGLTAVDLLLTVGANIAMDAASQHPARRDDRGDGDDVLAALAVGEQSRRRAESDNVIRVPVGVAIGFSLPLEGGIGLAPYAHMRASYDVCSACGTAGSARWQVSQNIDFGVAVTFSPQLAARVSAMTASSVFFNRRNALGASLAWSPGETTRSRRRPR